MKEWYLLKQDIAKYKEIADNDNNWRGRILSIKNNFSVMSTHYLKEISENDKDVRVQNEAKHKLNILQKYDIREEFNNVVTVKIIIPTGCNAKCSFCYNNSYSIYNTKEIFIKNLDNSIEKIINSVAPHFPISLDISGGGTHLRY